MTRSGRPGVDNPVEAGAAPFSAPLASAPDADPPPNAALRAPRRPRRTARALRRWEMPVQYEGVIPEHRAVRTDAGAFDVSHMGELSVEGANARGFLQSVLSNDLDRIGTGQAQYTLLTNEQGGIVDDLIAYELEPERFLLIVNASNREPDLAWLEERAPGDGIELRDVSDDCALIAVQGP